MQPRAAQSKTNFQKSSDPTSKCHRFERKAQNQKMLKSVQQSSRIKAIIKSNQKMTISLLIQILPPACIYRLSHSIGSSLNNKSWSGLKREIIKVPSLKTQKCLKIIASNYLFFRVQECCSNFLFILETNSWSKWDPYKIANFSVIQFIYFGP